MDSEPMCRACLSESGDAVPIFSSAETSGVQMPLSDMMMACSSVQVMSGDGLPGLICLECLRSLLIAFEFKLKCEKTDAMLREYIENNLVPMQIGTVYNKSMTVDSGTLVPVATSTNPTGEIKQIVGTNELISAIPTIAINSGNAIYSNANPYIIPMVECDVLVKEEQDSNMDGKIFQKASVDGTTSNIMLKKMTVESQTNLTPVNNVDMTTFSSRLIPSELIQQSPSQITIYGSEFRDLIRVSEEQQTTIVMPKIETIQAVNSMAQCNVLTTNSYTIDQNQLLQNSVINVSNSQNTTTNNNFISTMTIPSNVTFTIKESNSNIKKVKTTKKTEMNENSNQHIETNNPTISVDNSQQTSYHTATKLDSSTSNVDDSTSTAAQTDQPPVNKKQKVCHHKKKTVYSATNIIDSNKQVRNSSKIQKDNKNNNQQQTSGTKQVVIVQNQNEVVNSERDSENTTKTAKETVYYQHTNQGFIR